MSLNLCLNAIVLLSSVFVTKLCKSYTQLQGQPFFGLPKFYEIDPKAIVDQGLNTKFLNEINFILLGVRLSLNSYLCLFLRAIMQLFWLRSILYFTVESNGEIDNISLQICPDLLQIMVKIKKQAKCIL